MWSFVNIIQIHIYIFGYPLYDDLPNNAILMNVEFKKNPLNIINWTIYHYLISKSSRKIFIKINI
jgi:hypothetical protein